MCEVVAGTETAVGGHAPVVATHVVRHLGQDDLTGDVGDTSTWGNSIQYFIKIMHSMDEDISTIKRLALVIFMLLIYNNEYKCVQILEKYLTSLILGKPALV